jgi:hypothetical protein
MNQDDCGGSSGSGRDRSTRYSPHPATNSMVVDRPNDPLGGIVGASTDSIQTSVDFAVRCRERTEAERLGFKVFHTPPR